MNWVLACIRRLGLVAGLAGVGIAVRWATAGAFDQASRADLESLAVLVVAAAAWMAYCWLVLAVVATLLAQLPGVLGRSASVVAAGITSETSRRLLRSALGLAAAAPLTVGVAQAAPADHGSGAVIHSVHQPGPSEPSSKIALTARSNGRLSDQPQSERHRPTIDRPSKIHQATSRDDWASIEQPSTVSLSQPRRTPAPGQPPETRSRNWAPIERPSTIGLTEPGLTDADRIAVPDRPTVGTPTRYAEIRPADRSRHQPNARTPTRVVVRRGDSLWTIAAKELGPGASNATIAKRWPDWYAANVRVVGDDPDLLLPGQVLRTPKRTSPPTNDPRLSTKQRDNQEN